MTTEQTLPITKMLEEYKDEVSHYDWNHNILPQVRAIELESIAKAKQEERDRIVGILEEIKNSGTYYYNASVCLAINEAIDRITS